MMLGFSPLDVLQVFVGPLAAVLEWLDHAFRSFSPTDLIGPFGLAIIVVTLGLRTILFPLFSWQIKTTRRVWAENQLLKPELNRLRKKYKGDRTGLTAGTQELYKEHGMNPMSQMAGCLPLFAQIPVLAGLYNGIRQASQHLQGSPGFLGLPDMSKTVSELGGISSHHGVVLILPLLAAVATYASSKVMMLPVPPNASSQEAQMASINRTTTLIMPAMIFFFSLNVPQGIALYWVTQSVYMLAQEWVLIGFGELKVPSRVPGSGRKGPLDIDNVMSAVRRAKPSLDRLQITSHGASTAPVQLSKGARLPDDQRREGNTPSPRGNGRRPPARTGPPTRTGPPRGGQRKRSR